MKRLIGIAGLVLLHTACSGVSGQVDGESVPSASAYYVEEDNYYGDDGVFIVYLDSNPQGCEDQAAWQDEINSLDWTDLLDGDTWDDLEDFWAETFPEDFWVTTITIRVDDVDDSNGGLSLDGVDWGSGLTDDDEFVVSMTHYDGYLDWDEVQGTDLSWGDSFRSDGGDGVINAHSPGNSIGGSISTEMLDDGGNDEGEVNIAFSATRCDDFEDELF